MDDFGIELFVNYLIQCGIVHVKYKGDCLEIFQKGGIKIMGKPALQIVLDAIKNKRISLVTQHGETPETLEKNYRLRMPKELVDRAIEESKITVKHPKTGELITLGSLDGKKIFGLYVVYGEPIDIIKAEDSNDGSMG